MSGRAATIACLHASVPLAKGVNMSDRCEDRICYLAASAQTCVQNRSTARQCQQALKPHLAHFWLGLKDPYVFSIFTCVILVFSLSSVFVLNNICLAFIHAFYAFCS